MWSLFNNYQHFWAASHRFDHWRGWVWSCLVELHVRPTRPLFRLYWCPHALEYTVSKSAKTLQSQSKLAHRQLCHSCCKHGSIFPVSTIPVHFARTRTSSQPMETHTCSFGSTRAPLGMFQAAILPFGASGWHRAYPRLLCHSLGLLLGSRSAASGSLWIYRFAPGEVNVCRLILTFVRALPAQISTWLWRLRTPHLVLQLSPTANSTLVWNKQTT